MNGIVKDLQSIQRQIDAIIAKLSVGTKILDVPYLSQWGATANQRRGDCGPACIAMLAHYLTTHRPTVDQAAAACGQPTAGQGSLYTGYPELVRGASVYGIEMAVRNSYRPPSLTYDILQAKVNQGKPSIVLLHYGVLRDLTNKLVNVTKNQDQNYARGHWCLFIGYDEQGVYIHDPDYWPPRTSDGDGRYVPLDAFLAAHRAVAPGCTVGEQGLVVR